MPRQGLQRKPWDGTVREIATVWTEDGPDGAVWRCFLATHPDGWDLRLERSGELVRTHVFADQDRLLEEAAAWRQTIGRRGAESL